MGVRTKLRDRVMSGGEFAAMHGLGFIGSSSAAFLMSRGVNVIGIDPDGAKVRLSSMGECPVSQLSSWLTAAGAPFKRMAAVGSLGLVKESRDDHGKPFKIAVHHVAVPTEAEGAASDVALNEAIRSISEYDKDAIVIIESTIAPPYLDEIDRIFPDLQIAVAPRRDWFDSPEKNLTTLPRVIGSDDPELEDEIAEYLGVVCDTIVRARNAKSAALTKIVENGIRQIEIAYANELALELGDEYDVRAILELAATKWNIGLFRPSIGVGGYCLAADETVFTVNNDGVRAVRIEDFVAMRPTGQYVLGRRSDGTFGPVRVLGSDTRMSSLLRFKAIGGGCIHVTPDHLMVIQRRERLVHGSLKRDRLYGRLTYVERVVRADGVRVGDRLVFCDGPVVFDRDLSKDGRGDNIDLLEYAPGWTTRAASPERIVKEHTTASELPRNVPLDEEVAELLGYYCAEGCVTEDARTLRTYLTFNTSEIDLISFCTRVLDRLGVSYIEYDDAKWQAHQIRVSSAVWGRFVRDMTGGSSGLSHVPARIWTAPDSVKIAFLRGCVCGDGHVTARQTIEYFTSSCRMAQEVVLLLRTLGFFPSVKPHSQTPTGSVIILAGCNNRKRLASLLRGTKRKKLMSCAPLHQQDHPNVPSKIKQITRLPVSPVFSLEVEPPHTFLTSWGAVTHNCLPLAPRYLQLMEKPLSMTTASMTSSAAHIGHVASFLSKYKSVDFWTVAYKATAPFTPSSPSVWIIEKLMKNGVRVRVFAHGDRERSWAKSNGLEVRNWPDTDGADVLVIPVAHGDAVAMNDLSARRYLSRYKIILDNEDALRRISRSVWEDMGTDRRVPGRRGWLR